MAFWYRHHPKCLFCENASIILAPLSNILYVYERNPATVAFLTKAAEDTDSISFTMGSSSAPPSSRPLQGVRKLFQSFGRKTARPKHADAPASVSLQERLIPSTQLHNTLPEILLIIFDYLDTASLVCLQSTCKFLQNFIGIDPKSLDRCTRWLIMCYFEKDVDNPSSHPSPLQFQTYTFPFHVPKPQPQDQKTNQFLL